MKYNIHVTQAAERDMANAYDYIDLVLKNPTAADKLLDVADEKIGALAEFPHKFEVVADKLLSLWGIRFTNVMNYLAFYTVDDATQTVHIVRFLYGKSNWITILKTDAAQIVEKLLGPLWEGAPPAGGGGESFTQARRFRAKARLSPSGPSGHLPPRGRFFDTQSKRKFAGVLITEYFIWALTFVGAFSIETEYILYITVSSKTVDELAELYNFTSYGNQVLLDSGAGLPTRYAHMTQTAVTAGEAVTAGQVIGYVGNTGDSTGFHLHFEVMQNGVRVNPMDMVSVR